MKALKPDFLKWAELVASGLDDVTACQKVWPFLTKKSCQNKSGILRKNEALMEYLKGRADKINAEANSLIAEGLKTVELTKILTANDKRAILMKIITGELETEKVVIIKGVPKKVKCKPDSNEIMKAIEIDNKMSGDNVQAKPNQVAKAQEVQKILVVEDESNSFLPANSERRPDDNKKA